MREQGRLLKFTVFTSTHDSRGVPHATGTPVNGKETSGSVDIQLFEDGTCLLLYTDQGNGMKADEWYASLEEAKQIALEEFNIPLDCWACVRADV